jgi:hypothetical protein
MPEIELLNIERKITRRCNPRAGGAAFLSPALKRGETGANEESEVP